MTCLAHPMTDEVRWLLNQEKMPSQDSDRISHEAKTKKRMNEMDMNEYEKVTKVTSRCEVGESSQVNFGGIYQDFLRRFLPPAR